MGVAVIVGTEKGAALLRADDAREVWTVDALQLPGWIVTASTRDARGRFYVGVTSDVYGVTILTSEDLEAWEPVAEPPRYTPADRGNSEHNRIIRASDPQGRMQAEQRHVDQIWRLHAAGDVLYAGVSEAGLFRSIDRGASWEALHGLNDRGVGIRVRRALRARGARRWRQSRPAVGRDLGGGPLPLRRRRGELDREERGHRTRRRRRARRGAHRGVLRSRTRPRPGGPGRDLPAGSPRDVSHTTAATAGSRSRAVYRSGS